jgi:4-aminobutyrate aminotransferase-like enzyme
MVTTSTPENTEGALKQKERRVVPQGGWVKVNTDAGFCPLSKRASTGVVIWDDTGKVLLAAWKALGHCMEGVRAEVEAYL